ncbi:hypothetical protein CDD83_3694 [Cordyceps sp. RAO-2017]|nr:hypothetical protein CDD83_3694 [Cordyceps sp. RAO-2017]
MASQKIRLHHLAYVRYQHSDLDKACEFLRDFGLHEAGRADGCVYFRGYGSEPFVYCASKGDGPAFLGAAWAVDSAEDLERAAAVLPQASAVHDLDSPGGGRGVTFRDPVDGFPFELVFGRRPRGASDTDPDAAGAPERARNYPQRKRRPAGDTVRMDRGPAPVHKLGHFGLCVTDFAAAYDFFSTHFNLEPSDLVYDKAGRCITTFMHLGRGAEPVDHHAFFFFEGPEAHVHHASFEVHDFDVQCLGHHHLRSKGYDLVWGIGRHVMGSQIFDYWYLSSSCSLSSSAMLTAGCDRFDTSHFILEHYTDGDLVDDSTPVHRSEAHPNNLHVWGPEVPETFLN